MNSSPIPVDAKRLDWPRLVANAINSLQAAQARTEETIATLQDEVADLRARVEALEAP